MKRYETTDTKGVYKDNKTVGYAVFLLWVKAEPPNDICCYSFLGLSDAINFIAGIREAMSKTCDDMTRVDFLDPWEYRFNTTGQTDEETI